jgi:hypothetical protein
MVSTPMHGRLSSSLWGRSSKRANVDMDATTLATEATHYLETIGVCRSLDLDVRWCSEAEEQPGLPSPLLQMRGVLTSETCAGPLVRINGPHVCLKPSTGSRRSR